MAFTMTTDIATVTAGFTQAQLYTKLKAFLVSLYGAAYDEFTVSTTNSLVFQVILSGAAKGTIYVRVDLSTTTISCSHYETWNAGTHTGTSGSSAATNSWTTGSQVDFYGFINSEATMLFWKNGVVNGFLAGHIRPATKPSWYSETTYRYAFHFNSAQTATFSTAVVPSGSFTMSNLGIFGSTSTTALNGGKRMILTGKILINTSQGGYIGAFGNDWGEFAGSGVAFADTIKPTPGSEEWIVMMVSGNQLALRYV